MEVGWLQQQLLLSFFLTLEHLPCEVVAFTHASTQEEENCFQCMFSVCLSVCASAFLNFYLDWISCLHHISSSTGTKRKRKAFSQSHPATAHQQRHFCLSLSTYQHTTDTPLLSFPQSHYLLPIGVGGGVAFLRNKNKTNTHTHTNTPTNTTSTKTTHNKKTFPHSSFISCTQKITQLLFCFLHTQTHTSLQQTNNCTREDEDELVQNSLPFLFYFFFFFFFPPSIFSFAFLPFLTLSWLPSFLCFFVFFSVPSSLSFLLCFPSFLFPRLFLFLLSFFLVCTR